MLASKSPQPIFYSEEDGGGDDHFSNFKALLISISIRMIKPSVTENDLNL